MNKPKSDVETIRKQAADLRATIAHFEKKRGARVRARKLALEPEEVARVLQKKGRFEATSMIRAFADNIDVLSLGEQPSEGPPPIHDVKNAWDFLLKLHQAIAYAGLIAQDAAEKAIAAEDKALQDHLVALDAKIAEHEAKRQRWEELQALQAEFAPAQGE